MKTVSIFQIFQVSRFHGLAYLDQLLYLCIGRGATAAASAAQSACTSVVDACEKESLYTVHIDTPFPLQRVCRVATPELCCQLSKFMNAESLTRQKEDTALNFRSTGDPITDVLIVLISAGNELCNTYFAPSD